MTSFQLAFRTQAFFIANLVNLFLLLMALMLASLHQSWWPALLVGIPSALVPYLLYRTFGDQLLSRLSYGISFMFFSALHIHQSMGKTEVHFGIFVLLAVLIAFRCWKVILAAAVTIAVHHLLFMYLQFGGAAVYLVPQQDANLLTVLIHALYVVVEAAVLIVICKRSLREGMEGQALFDVTDALLTKDHKILISSRARDINSRLIHKFNGVLHTLQNTVSTIDASAQQLKAQSTELLEEGTALSTIMHRQLAEVEKINNASRGMSDGINQAVQLSEQMLQLARQAQSSARGGRQTVSATIAAIDSLTGQLQSSKQKVHGMAESTSEIRTVLEVIQSIAEQTNLLALNAAIEAARAGEQGRGFAVVADEVRTLASRTHGSTAEIKNMIGRLVQSSAESVQAVDQCLEQISTTVDFAKQSDTALQDISVQANAVVEAATAMTQALNEQDEASSHIAASISQLTQMTEAQTAQGQQVLHNADTVSRITTVLTEEANRFSQGQPS